MMKLLFLCTHNACRSILAEAIAVQRSQGNLTVNSAGSALAGTVHPLTLQHLQSHSYVIEGLNSKSWDDLEDYQPDIVITVCDAAAGESCPIWLNKAVKLHWGLPDPTHLQDKTVSVDEAFTQVIHTLEKRIDGLLTLDLKKPAAALKTQLLAL